MAKTPVAFGDDGRYVVKKTLGAGSYAHAYMAEHSGIPVAIKWLRTDSEEGGKQRFANEAWALAQLDHEAIPKLVETGTQEGRPYIVMTYAKGLDLRRVAERQKADGGAVAQRTVIAIAIAVLDALRHMHGRGICHRDVKDANVIFDEDGGTVMLVDLGMCKAASQPEDADTFWNAGASKFSPPSKLRYPSKVRPNHDVFAVGVLAYLLLTNRFPWDAGPDGDRGMLEDQMRSVRPIDIHDLNSVVDREVSRAFMSLLNTDDNRRPEAAAAHTALSELASRPHADRAGAAWRTVRALKCPRVLRDPLHGDVSMTDDEWELVNTPEFQRLRWLRQLGTTNLVYPGAEHT